jgi:two-component system KDP operon response regulator KdpE
MIVECGDLKIDLLRAEVRRDGGQIPLSMREYRLLLLLAQAGGELVETDVLMESLGKYYALQNLWVLIRRLRMKMALVPGRTQIVTVSGAGYRMGGFDE